MTVHAAYLGGTVCMERAVSTRQTVLSISLSTQAGLVSLSACAFAPLAFLSVHTHFDWISILIHLPLDTLTCQKKPDRARSSMAAAGFKAQQRFKSCFCAGRRMAAQHQRGNHQQTHFFPPPFLDTASDGCVVRPVYRNLKTGRRKT
ncbi:uncharacterized protein BKA78DRAFT_313872 [Phyllosticta capitalensis]|uniref:uncharacterized protein n=1 Tax=Phyllosticta capitalensis TaxID=121624 RepID=UPI0031313B2C